MLLGGCSLMLETETKACKKSDDCGAPYECQEGLCLVKTGCTKDADCHALGSKHAETICLDNVCSMPQCDAPEECEGGDTPTFTCFEGRCQDPVWACLGEPDDRETTMETATFKVEVIGLAEGHIPDLKILACAAVDTQCQTPLRSPVITYKDRIVTVSGLPQDSAIHLRFEDSVHITTDFYSQRLVRDETVEEVIELIPANVIPQLGLALGVVIDPTKALINVLTMDCSEPPVPQAGIRLELSDKPEGSEIFYLTDGNIPDISLDATTSAGAAGAVNLESGKQITVKAVLGDRVISTFPVTPYANSMTYVNLYPRSYKP